MNGKILFVNNPCTERFLAFLEGDSSYQVSVIAAGESADPQGYDIVCLPAGKSASLPAPFRLVIGKPLPLSIPGDAYVDEDASRECFLSCVK